MNFPEPETSITSIREARAWLQQNFQRGVGCPCCGQFVKAYCRKLNRGMALSLLYLYRWFYVLGRTEPVHAPTYLLECKANNSNEVGLLRHWDLIEEVGPPRRDDGGKHGGFYIVTDLGVRFVRDEATVASHVFLYNQILLGRKDASQITIRKALGSKFNYDELMRST